MTEYPKYVQIETINYCNARCWFCPTGANLLNRPRQTMSEIGFTSIINQLSQLPEHPKAIYPFLNGEPFLDPFMLEFLQTINHKLPNTHIILFTNASLLTKTLSSELLSQIKNIQDIWFSVNTLRADYNKTTGLNYNTLIQNISDFLTVRSKLRYPVNITYSFVGQESHYDQIIEEWEGMRGRIFFTGIKNFAGTITDHPDTERRIPSPCLRIQNYLTILSNGDTALCCMDANGQVSFGNVLKTPILDIWNNPLRLHYIDKHSKHEWNKLPLCKQCTGA